MLIKSLQETNDTYTCESCDYISSNKYYYNKHLLTARHMKLTKTLTSTTNCLKNTTNNFTCEKCDYISSKKSDYNKHLLTAKHIQLTSNILATNCLKNTTNRIDCSICHKTYYSRAGLWLHKKKCFIKEPLEIFCQETKNNIQHDSSKLIVNSDILDIIKENQEFKTLLIDQQRQVIELQKENNILMNKMVEISQNSLTVPSVINNNNNTTNNNNNQFNLNIFLNETCKNAINFSDFIDNIQVTDDDLENNVKMGFVEGVTKIIMDNLRLLELTNRPIHCTDVKRETIYVKVEEQWDKDNSIKVIQKGIQNITCKNMQQLVDWRENNPSYADDIDSELGEKSIMMQQNSMAGTKREEYYPKIIKNIAKESVISNKNGLIKK